jgi:AcrR family transcriptional regulator
MQVQMCPQRSNRQALIEGALSCLDEAPASRITARQIAAASNANLASIRYHFGSTEALTAYAMAEGFRRWLEEVAASMGDRAAASSTIERIDQAARLASESMHDYKGLIRAFFAAVARAPHDDELRAILAESYRDSREKIASLLGFGDDQDAELAALLLLATFDGLLIQAVLNPDKPISMTDLNRGLARLAHQAED